MASRTITVHEEQVGEPREGYQDTIKLDVGYTKGRGYTLSGRVVRIKENVMQFLLVTGIQYYGLLETANRFGAARLRRTAEAVQGGDHLAQIVEMFKTELARRVSAGEDY